MLVFVKNYSINSKWRESVLFSSTTKINWAVLWILMPLVPRDWIPRMPPFSMLKNPAILS